MRKSISAIVMTGASVLALGLAASPAGAVTAKTYTVSPGGAVTGTASKTTLTDTSTGAVLTCKSSSTKATLKSGSGNPGAKLGSITALTFATCTGPAGLTFTVATSGFPWYLNATSYANGVTHGTITGIHAVLSGSGCSATVDGTGASADNGSVKATYTNSTGKLKVLTTGGNLTIYNVNGCFGLLNSGDSTTFAGTYTISPKQTITSP